MAQCSKCGKSHDRNGRYCLSCHNAYMREWRKGRALKEDQRKKDSARSYAGVYKRRGKLVPEPCEVCDSVDVEMHHENYDEPLVVRWLCRRCHMEEHRDNR